MTKLSEIEGTLQDKLLIFLNEYIIGSRQASRILKDLHTLYITAGSICQKLRAVLKLKPDHKIRTSVKELLSIAENSDQCNTPTEIDSFNQLLSNHISIMQHQQQFQPDLSAL